MATSRNLSNVRRHKSSTSVEDGVAIGCGCSIILLWIIGVLLSLALTGALIYLVIQIANGNVF